MHGRLIGICVFPAAFAIAACSSSENNAGGPADSGGSSDAGDATSDAVVDSGADSSGDATRLSEAGQVDGQTDSGETGDGQTDSGETSDGPSDSGETGDSPSDAGDSGSTTAASAVYTMSNAAAGNTLLGFLRGADGTLTPMAGPFATGGKGSGAALGEQGAIAYDFSTNRIYVVNAGDNTFSILPVTATGSLGAAVNVSASSTSLVGPKSITFNGSTVYVLYEGNATTPSMIAGYAVSDVAGVLSAAPIAGSALALSSSSQSVDPAQIEFAPGGQWLVVTEKQDLTGDSGVSGAGGIDTFAVDSTGLATKKGFYPTASAGADAGAQLTPYGFGFAAGYLIVSEAGSTGVGSYSYTGGVIAAAAPTSGGAQFVSSDPAPCWVATASTWAYVANAKGPDVSGYTVSAATGGLTPIGAVANAVVASTGATIATDAGPTIEGPTDESVSSDGQFLYVLNGAVPSIGIFQIHADGTLTRVGAADYAPSSASALPTGAVGIVAR
ncbi:MAG: hypothetical protein ABSC94_13310 [Polyangiaceae bacterium]|jgi:hypothetical protein